MLFFHVMALMPCRELKPWLWHAVRAGGNPGCLNNNKSMPAQFYQAAIQRVTFHIPSEHTIYGASG
jgi:hypothetical protein